MVMPATAEQIEAFALSRGITDSAARKQLETLRERQIENRRSDPYTYGYEPPIWFVTKALMRNPCWSEYERVTIRRKMGLDAETFADRMRRRLGFEHAVTKVLIMGAW